MNNKKQWAKRKEIKFVIVVLVSAVEPSAAHKIRIKSE